MKNKGTEAEQEFTVENVMEATAAAGTEQRRVSQSLIKELSPSELEDAKKLPSLDLDDLEQVNYLQTIAEGWAYPLKRFMNEQELIESLNMNTVTDEDGKKHILSVPITQYVTEKQKADLEGASRIAIKCSQLKGHEDDILAIIEKPEFFDNRKEEICTKTFGTGSLKHQKVERIYKQGDFLVSGESM
jgi:3'-phosphoadenosine 5'-phosphosulfate synthase